MALTYVSLASMGLQAGDRERELDRDRDSIFRIRDHRRRLETTFRDETLKSLEREREKADASSADGSKKANSPAPNPLSFGEELQYWTDKVCTLLLFIDFISLIS